jgi:hypothetical protein
MSAAQVSIYVREDTVLVDHVHVFDAGEPRAWLYIDEAQDAAVWGSPPALRRLAAAAVAAAEHADALLAPRRVGGGLDGASVAAGGRAGTGGGGGVVMAIDDLLDRARDLRRRRDEAVAELAALEGLEGVGMIDETQRRELTRLRDRPGARATARRRRTARPRSAKG